jgi:hypothetical protein
MEEKIPSLIIERPKIPSATRDALRAHIVQERQRKKDKTPLSNINNLNPRRRCEKQDNETISIISTNLVAATSEPPSASASPSGLSRQDVTS